MCGTQWGAVGGRVSGGGGGCTTAGCARAWWENVEILEGETSRSTLGSIGEADGMAGAVVYLASGAASFVTGQTLLLDGGNSA